MQAVIKEIAGIQNCEIAGWQKRQSAHTLFVNFRVFKDGLPDITRYIALQFLQITELVMPFRYSESILFVRVSDFFALAKIRAHVRYI